MAYQWRIQDFPRGGRVISPGGVVNSKQTCLRKFPETCMKSKEFGLPGRGGEGGVGAHVPRVPLNPLMLTDPLASIFNSIF